MFFVPLGSVSYTHLDVYKRQVQDGVYYVSGAWPEKVIQSVNFDDYESRMYFERVLRRAGVFDMLEKAGVQEGDTVDVCGCQFEYVY